jgi:hypothetical protein
MDMRAAELAADRLEAARRFSFHASVLAAATLVLTAAVWIWFPAALLPMAILAALEGLVVLWAYYTGRDLLQRLALEPFADEIPEVRRYGERLLKQDERDRLAASIDSLIAGAKVPGAFFLVDRIVLFEDQLRALARELATPTVPIQARSVVTCVRLLTRGVESPLFNPSVPVEQLRSTLLRIRFGIGKRTDD